MTLFISCVLLVIGFVMLIKGADWFVEGTSGIADKFGIPQLVIGLTIVAMGTSAPEAAVSITSALKGSAGIAIGNIIGSNILNVLLILGLTSLVVAIPVQKSTLKYEVPFVIFISVLLPVFGLADGQISRVEGVIFWILFIAFLLYLLNMSKKGAVKVEEEAEEKKERTIPQLIFLSIIGLILIVWGSNTTVDSASQIARIFGMSERLIGLTIVAFGTSLPELITSVTAGMKGKADIAIGNIVGSNIFNILFVLGTTALIIPVPYAANFLIDSIVCAASVAVLLVCVLRKQKLTKSGGIIMLLMYAGYFVYLVQ